MERKNFCARKVIRRRIETQPNTDGAPDLLRPPVERSRPTPPYKRGHDGRIEMKHGTSGASKAGERTVIEACCACDAFEARSPTATAPLRQSLFRESETRSSPLFSHTLTHSDLGGKRFFIILESASDFFSSPMP